MSRMEPLRIDIPAYDAGKQAADIVIAAVKEAGLDPKKAIDSVMVQTLTIEWRDARITREQFIHSLKNLAILNPSLR